MLFTQIRALDNACWTETRVFEIKEFYKTGNIALFNLLLSFYAVFPQCGSMLFFEQNSAFYFSWMLIIHFNIFVKRYLILSLPLKPYLTHYRRVFWDSRVKRPEKLPEVCGGSSNVLEWRWSRPFMHVYATLVGWGSMRCLLRFSTQCTYTNDVASRWLRLSVRQWRKTTTPRSSCQSKDI